jgi:hypothetical protein
MWKLLARLNIRLLIASGPVFGCAINMVASGAAPPYAVSSKQKRHFPGEENATFIGVKMGGQTQAE